jgi:hypothetical protein
LRIPDAAARKLVEIANASAARQLSPLVLRSVPDCGATNPWLHGIWVTVIVAAGWRIYGFGGRCRSGILKSILKLPAVVNDLARNWAAELAGLRDGRYRRKTLERRPRGALWR